MNKDYWIFLLSAFASYVVTALVLKDAEYAKFSTFVIGGAFIYSKIGKK